MFSSVDIVGNARTTQCLIILTGIDENDRITKLAMTRFCDPRSNSNQTRQKLKIKTKLLSLILNVDHALSLDDGDTRQAGMPPALDFFHCYR
jgi:hypothetical protein